MMIYKKTKEDMLKKWSPVINEQSNEIEKIINQRNKILRDLENWNNQQIKIATKNSLKNNVCDNCFRSKYCKIARNKFNSCYAWKSALKFILPIIRRVAPTTIANSLVSTQPISKPSSQIFYLNYKFKKSFFSRIKEIIWPKKTKK